MGICTSASPHVKAASAGSSGIKAVTLCPSSFSRACSLFRFTQDQLGGWYISRQTHDESSSGFKSTFAWALSSRSLARFRSCEKVITVWTGIRRLQLARFFSLSVFILRITSLSHYGSSDDHSTEYIQTNSNCTVPQNNS